MKRGWVLIAQLTIASVLCLFVSSAVFWWLYPYPPNASREQIVAIWAIHVVTEKVAGYLLSTSISIVVTLLTWRQLQRKSVYLGAIAGIPYHVIIGAIYIYRFGLAAFMANSRPLGALSITILLSFFASLAALVIARRLGRQTQREIQAGTALK